MPSSPPSPSPPPFPQQPRDNKLFSARRLVLIPGTGELIASTFPRAAKKKAGGVSGSNSNDAWESSSAAAAKSTTSNTLSPSRRKRLVVYSVDAPRNLAPALRPGKGESAKKKQQREGAEASRIEKAALAVASCTLRPFLTTNRAFAVAASRAAEICVTAPTNAGVLSEAAKVARRAAALL